jgi:hypothetical protein
MGVVELLGIVQAKAEKYINGYELVIKDFKNQLENT